MRRVEERLRAIGETVAGPSIQFFDYLCKEPRGEMGGQEARRP